MITVNIRDKFLEIRPVTQDNLDAELYTSKTLVKIRCMRGTLYILTKDMLPVAYAATKELVEKLSRRYAEFRGISSEEYSSLSVSVLNLLRKQGVLAFLSERTLSD